MLNIYEAKLLIGLCALLFSFETLFMSRWAIRAFGRSKCSKAASTSGARKALLRSGELSSLDRSDSPSFCAFLSLSSVSASKTPSFRNDFPACSVFLLRG